MSRQNWRRASLVFLFDFGGLLVYLGFDGWTFNKVLPTHFAGFFLIASGIAGLFEVNIWHGGPLDPRFDPSNKLTPTMNAVDAEYRHDIRME